MTAIAQRATTLASARRFAAESGLLFLSAGEKFKGLQEGGGWGGRVGSNFVLAQRQSVVAALAAAFPHMGWAMFDGRRGGSGKPAPVSLPRVSSTSVLFDSNNHDLGTRVSLPPLRARTPSVVPPGLSTGEN
eukprot:CAMPEP_0114108424 /NCGR_PEP_ID=MMETSP0043_2-20121206/218_1 /TAXON_ID=464988 /ORGANISM="Hemiselmis andersenii, Strain CCMP644" /LENGTH=131 /DNA_ID=CAMNT_0001200199 /DNA_START=459 /DNA_END=851 /DNA_ORIENTATION=+